MQPVHGRMKITEVECKSALTPSGLADYALNCYVGCQHNCLYCYARFMKRFTGHEEPWGGFVDVKINAPQVLRRQLKRAGKGRVFLSSVCDAWQPLEDKYRLTRSCLELLLEHGFPLTILTKSDLIRRDLDLLAKAEVDLGLTLTALDPKLKKAFEPNSSSTAARFEVLREAKRKGIKIYAFIGPLMPYLTDLRENLDGLMQEIADIGVDYFYLDRLNCRWGVWSSLKEALNRYYPELVLKFQRVLFDPARREDYSSELKERASEVARKFGLHEKLRFCF